MANRLAGDSSIPVALYLTDLLRYENWDIRAVPLWERKELLATLLPGDPGLLFTEHLRVRGEEFHAACAAAGLPGAIARRVTSPYPGAPGSRLLPAKVNSGEESRKHPDPVGDLPTASAFPQIRRAPTPATISSPACPVGAPSATDSRPIRLTNLDKVFWPDPGYTKGDLIRYYDRVAEFILPYLHERPAHLLRYPDGVRGKAFYQKDLPEHTPDWIEIEEIASGSRSETIRYLVVNDPSALLWAANAGSIDIHPWLSLRTRRDRPDWAVFDLDPGSGPFSDVVRLARAFGKVLRGIGLRPLLKTSGASGLHIYVPLEPRYPYGAVRQFCEAVSVHVASEHPEIATVERSVAKRRGRVYLDYMQNRRGQTIVPPYAARPVAAASVSAPLDWDELDADLAPDRFTIRNMPERLSRLGDLFAGALHDAQPLLPAIRRFGERYADVAGRRRTRRSAR